MSHFTDEEREMLAPYVTDTSGDVFAVRNLQNIVGAAYARYSRAHGGFRETLLKEFIKEGHIDAKHAHDLIERVLIAFGDDSVGELEGAHLSFENISILATKEIEDRRIGGSPIEQSTRYVFFDKKDTDGNYRYIRDDAILASSHGKNYTETMDFIFSTYCELMEPMQEFYRKRMPIESASYDINGDEKKECYAELTDKKDQKAFRLTYKMDTRTKACDTLRYLLPIGTKTNVGLFGNGRFFQGLLSFCFSSDIPEVQRIAKEAKEALREIIPRYVQRASRKEYLVDTRRAMQDLTNKIMEGIPANATTDVTLAEQGESFIEKTLHEQPNANTSLENKLQEERDIFMISHMLYPYASHPLKQIQDIVRNMTIETRHEITKTYTGNRGNRRNRPGRALEAGYSYTFDCLTDFGTYKDLMRHRMTTQMRQKFSPLLGFVMPPDLEKAGFAEKAKECHTRAVELYTRLLPDFPEQASYATLHGSKVRWLIGMNDREAMHLIELRTTPQGHPSYRKVAQKMHLAIRERSPWRAEMIAFADHNDYTSARGDSEARQRAKERDLDEKKG